MFSRKLFVSSCLMLAGCSASLPGPWAEWSLAKQASHAEAGVPSARGQQGDVAYSAFRFDWELHGDPQVMPLQVFDDGMRTWLQFPPEGAWPAVFEEGHAGWRALGYRREGPYMVLDGVFDRLVLRGGHLQASVRRAGVAAAPVPAAGIAATVVAPVESVSTGIGPAVSGAEPVEALHVPGLSERPMTMEAAASGPDSQVYSVGPADLTVRQALQRWAGNAGWTFTPEHWSVDVDIPLVGHASFAADFRSAVREMLAATEMGDRPVQPCFYSNRVLRVVPSSQPCDRRKGMGAIS